MQLAKISASAPDHLDKDSIKQKTKALLEELDELQYLLYAEGKHSVLIVMQGMDASGKDGAIKNVFGTLNPQGVMVRSFKAPTAEELSHDFLWRIHAHTPAKGYIQVFNRSHYEDILVTRVHKLIDDETALQRIDAINHFETLLIQHSNTSILKFYLHISQEEQSQRFAERLKDPRKMWKYNAKDFDEAKLWDNYMAAYDECFEKCTVVPWQIIPADQNWYKEFLIAEALHKTLKSLNMSYPGIKQ